MNRARLSIFVVLVLTACASPVRGMAPMQVAALSDYQLCGLSIGYRYEPNTEAEIGRRGLVCTPEAMRCMGQGIGQHDPAFGFCVAAAQLQDAAEAQADQVAWERARALEKYGDNANAKHLFIWQ